MDTLLDFQADILLGDTSITLKEAQELLARPAGLPESKTAGSKWTNTNFKTSWMPTKRRWR